MCIGGVKRGRLLYIGRTHFAEGEWCGVHLEEPDGRHDGEVSGVRYFTCPEQHGIFAPVAKVSLATDATDATPSPSARETDENGNADRRTKSRLKQPKFKSKLAKPKAIVKPLQGTSCTQDSQHEDTGIGGTSGDTTCKLAKPSQLPVQDHKRVEHRTKRRESRKNVTFQVDDDADDELNESFDYDIPEVTTPSRVDAASALTLAYDLESSGSDSENRAAFKQLSRPSELLEQGSKKQTSSHSKDLKPAEPGLTSPLPDLLTSTNFQAASEPIEAAGEAMSESEAEEDFLAESAASQASSLGILSDSQLADNSLVPADKQRVGRQISRDSVELSERELDREIAGVATPDAQSEVEMSSSTISCDSLPLQVGVDGDPLGSPAKGLLGRRPAPGAAAAASQQPGDASGKAQDSSDAGLFPVDNTELDEVDGGTVAVSIEIAKTAVSQYADLVQSAEASKEAREAEKTAKRVRLEELRAKRCSVEMEVDPPAPAEDGPESALVELRQDYTSAPRPLSTCSIDTGIGMDSSITSLESDCRRDRPLSLVSSVSTDAGKALLHAYVSVSEGVKEARILSQAGQGNFVRMVNRTRGHRAWSVPLCSGASFHLFQAGPGCLLQMHVQRLAFHFLCITCCGWPVVVRFEQTADCCDRDCATVAVCLRCLWHLR